MKIMRLDNKNISDLEYLAGRGFETTPYSDIDLDELRSKIKARSFSYNSGSYFTFISLICGVFIGISVFFSVYTAPLSTIPVHKLASHAKKTETHFKDAIVALDTINFVKENFISQHRMHKKNANAVPQVEKPKELDSASGIASLPVELSALRNEKLKEPEIRYIPNSPIIYLHDLKITDYSFLYFKKNKFISLKANEGINASYENRDDYKAYGNILEPSRNYYLHEAIADAMLQFQNKNYAACINILNNISQFTGNDINCKFYMGMCNFYRKNYGTALKYLDDCISNPNNTFLQESEYYKALCLFELGNKQSAADLMKKIVEDGGFYAGKAENFLKGKAKD